VSLSGSATPNETDWATFTYYGEAYNAPMFDSNTDIASVWTQAEFNIVGIMAARRPSLTTVLPSL
jgi:hypothetical protein